MAPLGSLAIMHINRLEIANFKALTRFALEDLGDAVVLAGPNGCGKSCVLDAIRLLKSTYGGYQPNEWHQWFGEFQIAFNQRPGDLLRLFQDPTRDLSIEASFSFADSERTWFRATATELARAAAWREVVPELAGWRSLTTTPMASQFRAHNEEVERRAAIALSELMQELDQDEVTASVRVNTSGAIETGSSRLLELAFSNYEPDHIGLLDFHGANRQYAREQIAGVNLDLSSMEEQRRSSALYNPQAKHAGLKAEMASVYVRGILSEQASEDSEVRDDDLVESLQELFRTFFPGKTFAGPEPTPDGRIDFPVRLPDGSAHDLDDLSSGEKEVLYGYMRLRKSAPPNSVVLLDEPELHLNPRLIRGLARFYLNRLVAARSNQLWLISHSDTLLREAVTLEGFQVFHMRPGERARPDENQAARITSGEELERLVIELVGDLAAYRPGAKVVLFEGGGDVEFDVRMVSRLFPDFDADVNSIAAGSKQQVTRLHETLEKLGAASLGARFYAIRDRDSGPRQEQVARLYSWDVYHIENYLLEAEYVLRALADLSQADSSLTDVAAVEAALQNCAEDTISPLVRHELIEDANDRLRQALRVGGDPRAQAIVATLHPSVESSIERAADLGENELSREALERREEELRAGFSGDLVSGDWYRTFRGRDVLNRFAAQHVHGTNYESFRDLILARMKEANFQPPGMATILNSVREDSFP